MPRKPQIVSLEGTSVDILNAIRKDNGGFYQSLVPVAEQTTDSIRQIGTLIMGSQPLQNAFLSALVNRIGRVIITSKMYDNPWSFFKKGMLEYGETVEEIFVNIAKPHQFNPNKAENEVFKREIPDVKAEFHPMNYQKFYKTTVSNDHLRQAFLSWSGITDLIGKIIDSLYTGANYDEFLTMKYLIGRMALVGRIKPIEISDLNSSTAKGIVTTFKATSNKLEFLSSDYNAAAVKTHSVKNDQYLITTSELDAFIDVEVLASAFNMSKAEFMGHRAQVDGFHMVDNERLEELFADDPSFVPFTETELAQLKVLQAVLIDKDWFMIFDNYQNMTEQYNGEGLYWNYWLHVWKTFSVSPFSNAVLFTNGIQQVTSVTVSPSTSSLKKGLRLQLISDVVTKGFVSTDVTWSMTGNVSPNTTLSPNGLLTVGADETGVTLTIKATSTVDKTKVGTATITVTA